MTPRDRDYPYARAASAGIATGMRGTVAITAIAYAARQGALSVRYPHLDRLLQAQPTLPLLATAVVGELIVDKLPMTPSRLEPGPLVGRLVGSGVTGALVSRGRGGSSITGALVGAVTALASSWAFGRGRVKISARTGVPDPVVAIGEDGLAIAFASLAAAPYSTDTRHG